MIKQKKCRVKITVNVAVNRNLPSKQKQEFIIFNAKLKVVNCVFDGIAFVSTPLNIESY